MLLTLLQILFYGGVACFALTSGQTREHGLNVAGVSAAILAIVLLVSLI